MPGLVNELATEVVIRPLTAVRPAEMADWLNRQHWNPGPLGGAPVSADDYATFVRERGNVETFVALHRERVVGSLALYPVSAQKAGRGAVVWMDTFAIDPEFRSGTVSMRLFLEAFVRCLADSYDRVDCNASPANPPMIAIVKAGGFKRVSVEPCGDDRLEFRSYLPYVYRYIISALGLGDRLAEVAREWTDLSTTPWVPAPGRGEGVDLEDYHGARVFRYVLRADRERATFVVDVDHDRMCAVEWGPLRVDFHPVSPARETPVGGAVEFAHAVANAGTEPLRVTLAAGRPGEDPLWTHEAEVPAGGTVDGRIPVPVTAVGSNAVELTVRTSVIHLDGRHPATLRLHGWVTGVAAASVKPAGAARSLDSRGPRLAETAGHWTVTNDWLRLAVDRTTGTLTVTPRTGAGPAVRELWPDVGPPFPSALKTPPPRELSCAGFDIVDGAAVLTLRAPANEWWRRHAAAYRRQGRPGAGLADAVLQRRLVIGSDQRVGVHTELLADAGTAAEVAAGSHLLRTHPWADGRSLTLAVPLDTGVFRSPLVYERFPFGMHSLEFPGSLDLPRDPGRYAEGWTAYTDGGHSVGLLWERAAEVRYSLQWMPSLLLAADGPHFPTYTLFCGPGDERAVRAAWAATTGAAPDTADRAPLLAPVPVRLSVAPLAAGGTDGEVELSARVEVLSARPREGELTASVGSAAPVVVFAGTLDGATTHPVTALLPGAETALLPGAETAGDLAPARLTWTERHGAQRATAGVVIVPSGAKPVDVRADDDLWLLGNGRLELDVAPDYAATVVSLRADGVELVRSTYPKPRPLGIVRAGRGGVGPALVAHRADPMASLAQEVFAWTPTGAAPTETVIDGTSWTGVTLSGRVDTGGSTVDLDLAYLLAPGAPVLLVVARFATAPPGVFSLAAHLDPGTAWTFAGGRGAAGFEYRAGPPGSNRPVGGARGHAALVGDRAVVLAAAGDAEVVGFRDGDDWSIRSLATGTDVAACCLAVVDAATPLAHAGVLRRIARSACAQPAAVQP